jgi:hypothetical protein
LKSVIIHAQGMGFYGSAIAIVVFSGVPIHAMLAKAAQNAGFTQTESGWDRSNTSVTFTDSDIQVNLDPVVVLDTGNCDEDLQAVQDILAKLHELPVDGVANSVRNRVRLKSEELEGEVENATTEEDNLEFQRMREELDKPKTVYPAELPADVVEDRN